jgi:hypothetical protein
MGRASLLLALLTWAAGTGAAWAQLATPGGTTRAIDGPPPPQFPEVITRDDRGRVTVRATRLSEPFRLDGELTETAYESVPPIPGLIQNVPDEGQPSSERTEAWVFFDGANLYICARLWESAPPSQWVVNEMRRDAFQINNNENFGVMLDTFYDRRNGYMFYANPLGALRDFQITSEGNANGDWSAVWNARSGRFDGGWTLEMQIPFKSLRYSPGREQVWGIQFRRGIKHKNEWAYLTSMPATAGASAWARISMAGTLVGLEVPSGSRNLDIMPYAIAGLRTDRAAVPAMVNDIDRNVGFDVKYGITQNAMLDLTYNTDFAQVEVDEQQINLTRFNLLFPEKREFFLDGRGLYDFGVGNNNTSGLSSANPAPQLFFSRRIGLDRGRVIPIQAGGRLTAKWGPLALGALNIQTDDEPVSRTPKTNFSVLRVRRNILSRSSVGMMFTGRSRSAAVPTASSHALGVDSAFSFGDVNMHGYYAKTQTAERTGREDSYVAHADYYGDLYGAMLDHAFVGDDFNPEVGYVQRQDMRRTFAAARMSPRPKANPLVRQVSWTASFEYVQNLAGALESRDQGLTFWTDFQNSDRLTVKAERNYDLLTQPFRLAGGPLIASGGYDFGNVQASYAFGTQRPISGTVSAQTGTYYDGHQKSLGVSAGRVQLSERLYLEPSLAINWFTFPYASLQTRVIRTRASYTFTPRMYVSGLVQYNSSGETLGSNFRFRWEYIPGSELTIVYTEERDTGGLHPASSLLNRGFVVKINRLLRF